jgi:hypothetical protein
LGQTNYRCSCQGIIDPDYKGVVEIFDNPNGKVTHSVRQDFKNEDFLIFQIDSVSSFHFHATMTYSMSGKRFVGWVPKKKYLGTFPRAYADTIYLYRKPTTQSKPLATIAPGNDALVQIINCGNKWVYIKTKKSGALLQGWLKPEDQCSNPYTTCN